MKQRWPIATMHMRGTWRRWLLWIWNTLSWASYQIRKIAGCACAGNAGNVFPRRRFQRKPLVSDPGMHHGTCETHVPWCISGSLTRDDGENVPGIPGACAPAILRIWQKAHTEPMVIWCLNCCVLCVAFYWEYNKLTHLQAWSGISLSHSPI